MFTSILYIVLLYHYSLYIFVHDTNQNYMCMIVLFSVSCMCCSLCAVLFLLLCAAYCCIFCFCVLCVCILCACCVHVVLYSVFCSVLCCIRILYLLMYRNIRILLCCILVSVHIYVCRCISVYCVYLISVYCVRVCVRMCEDWFAHNPIPPMLVAYAGIG